MNPSLPDLDDLNLINREIAALVRAGVPIEFGLRGLAGDESFRFGTIANRLAERLAEGRTLSEALSVEDSAMSATQAAVTEAGLMSGKLPEALESLADTGQMIQDLRRRIILALIYPGICLIVAYGLFCLFISVFAPEVIRLLELFRHSWALDTLRFLNRNHGYFTLVIPSITLTVIVISILLRHGPTKRLWQQLTSPRWIVGSSLNWTQFTELLALQIDHNCPLSKAFVVAANSVDDVRWQNQAATVTEKLASGSSFEESLRSATSLPPLVRWMLVAGEKQGTLGSTLHRLSDTYRQRALRRVAIIKVWLPVAITICCTGVIGLSYGLTFFIPLRAFLEGLALE